MEELFPQPSLYQQILTQICAKEKIEVSFPNLTLDAEALVHDTCYQILQRIAEIIRDDTLEDPECFMKIEEIVCLFEQHGLNAGTRHDF